MENINAKPAAFTFFLASLLWVSCPGQDTIGIRIEKIEMECDRINKAITILKIVEEEIDDQSTEGGRLQKYYEENGIRKAILSLFGESGKSIYEYYFLDKELIFVSEVEIIYEAPIYMGKIEIESTDTEKYYFDNQKLGLWIDHDGKPMDPTLYPDKGKEFLDDLKTIIKKDG